MNGGAPGEGRRAMDFDWMGLEEDGGTCIHSVCRYGSLADALALFKRSPSLAQRRDQMQQFPLHAACCNHRLYGWKIVKFLVAAYPEAARHADTLGRLPLHLAAANEGPTHDARGLPLWCGTAPPAAASGPGNMLPCPYCHCGVPVSSCVRAASRP